MISAVLIVKNEEKLIQKCLDSILDVDEIIVCDTGSSDSTIEILEQNNVKIVYFEWCDDFGAARNYAKSHASNDWVLSIDADETLEEGGVDKIRDFIRTTQSEAATVTMKAEYGYARHFLVRVFKKHCDWSGKVHETVSSPSTEHIDVQIDYGYSPAHDLDPDIDMRILESIEDPIPRDLYYLAREYFYREMWQKALDGFNKYLEEATWKPEKADALLYAARCCWNMHRGDEARTYCLEAINLNAHFKEAIVLMGEMSWPDNRMMWWKMSEFADNRNVLFVRT
jgi:glycosyltransferase involved in cell wall biosynthesis